MSGVGSMEREAAEKKRRESLMNALCAMDDYDWWDESNGAARAGI